MPEDDLPYLIVALRQIPGPPVILAAASSAEDAQVIARALERAAGVRKDTYRVVVKPT